MKLFAFLRDTLVFYVHVSKVSVNMFDRNLLEEMV